MSHPARARTPTSLLAALALLLPSVSQAATEADLSEFFRRVSSLGMSTRFLRKMTTGADAPVEVFYRAPNSDREAQYGYILNNVEIPFSHKEENSTRVKFDLETHHLATMFHELTHAANDEPADKDAAAGTPEFEHWQCREFVWAEIFNDPRHHNIVGLARYPRFKADEITGYYMGCAIQKVFDAANDIIFINEKLVQRTARTPQEARDLGDTLVLQRWDLENDHMTRRVLESVFWKCEMGNDSAYFEGKAIPYDNTGKDWLKQRMFDNLLGLSPPRDTPTLLATLNSPRLRNRWIRGVRQRVRAARLAWAEKQERAAVERAAAEAAGAGAVRRGEGEAVLGQDGDGN